MGDVLIFGFLLLVGAAIWASNNTARLPNWLSRLVGEPRAPELAPLTAERAVEPAEVPSEVTMPVAHAGPPERHTGLLGTLSAAGLSDVVVEAHDEDDFGTVYTLRLQGGMTVDDVAARQGKLASMLSVPPRLVEVTQGRNDPGDVVRLWVGKERPESTTRVTLPEITRWADSFRIGIDLRGNEVRAQTKATNTLVGGVMRQGKTTLERHFAARAILDPATIVIIVDGKGSVKDWEAAEGHVNALILGSDDDALERLSKVFQWVIKESDRRNAQKGREHPGIVIILDELQDLFTSADKATLKQLIRQLGRVLRKGAAAGVHVVIGTQRPGADEIPTTIRDVIEQKVGLKARDKTAMDLILGKGQTGNATLPSVPGEALYMHGEFPTLVTLDYLSDEEWERACASAPRRDTLDLTDTESVIGFFDRVIAAMGDKEIMTVEELAKALGKSTAAFGRELSMNGYTTRRDSSGKKAVWLHELQSLDNQDG